MTSKIFFFIITFLSLLFAQVHSLAISTNPQDEFELEARDVVKQTGPTGYTTSLTQLGGVLKIHNQYRAHHGVPPLQWDPVLAKAALKSARTCIFKHTTPYVYGENLAAGTLNNPAFYVYL